MTPETDEHEDLERFRQRADGNGFEHGTIRTSDAIAEAMLNACLGRAARRILKSPPALIVIQTGTAEFAELVENYLQKVNRAPVVESVTEVKRHGPDIGAMATSALERGRSIVLVTQDPERLLPAEIVRGGDLVVEMPTPDAKVIRRAVRRVTGQQARGLRNADVSGLSLLDMLLAIRPGLTAGECVQNLRRAGNGGVDNALADAVPLEALPLTSELAAWAHDTLDIMKKVGVGELEASALRFAWFDGAPGTGKSTIAKSLARSAGWRFLAGNMDDFFDKGDGHLGAVIKNVRTFFETLASSDTPIVGFVDEIDSLPNRSTMDGRDSTWWTPVVNCLLTQIDRLRKAGRPVLLLGATNHPRKLDAALVRAGRLETRVSMQLPSESERKAVFEHYLGKRLSDDEMGILARLAVRHTAAEIESVTSAALSAAQRESRELLVQDVIALLVSAGERSSEMDWAIALHEAGHAVVAMEVGVPIREISIVGSGDHGGFVSVDTNGMIMTRRVVEAVATTLLGGRASDEILGSGANAGAAADIESANGIVRRAMLELGLYGTLTDRSNTDPGDWNGAGRSFAASIRAILDDLHERAIGIVLERQDDVVRLAERLMADRVLGEAGIRSVIGERSANPSPPDSDVQR